MIEYRSIAVITRNYVTDEEREYIVDGAFWHSSEYIPVEYIYGANSVGEEYIVFYSGLV